jgi:MFS family permease
VLGACVAAACAASAATPLACAAVLGPVVAARVVEGLAQGPIFPTMWGMLGTWLPATEVSLGASVANSGFGVGSMAAFLVSPTIMARFGWRALFYAPAGLGVLWTALWLGLAADSPAAHPRVSPAERALIAGGPARPPAHAERHDHPVAPATAPGRSWRHRCRGAVGPAPHPSGPERPHPASPSHCPMRRAPALWGQIVCDFAANWFFYVVFTFLPQYLSMVLAFDVDAAAWLTGASSHDGAAVMLTPPRLVCMQNHP